MKSLRVVWPLAPCIALLAMADTAAAIPLPDNSHSNCGSSTACLNITNDNTSSSSLSISGNTPSGVGVRGSSQGTSSTAYGVSGLQNYAFGTAPGVYGKSVSTTGIGVKGDAVGASSTGVLGSATAGVGVKGEVTSASGIGVLGNGGPGIGVKGTASSSYPNVGLLGENTAQFGVAIHAVGTGASSLGIFAEAQGQGIEADAYGDGAVGVAGTSTGTNGVAIIAQCVENCSNSEGYALQAYGRAGGTTAWLQLSDARLKKDIVEEAYGLAEILKLRPVSYKLKEGNDGTQLGLIAQEVRAIVPEVVHGDERVGMLSVGYSSLVPVLIKAIQEQNDHIARLERERTPLLSSIFSGNLGAGLALGSLPFAVAAVLRRRRKDR